VVEQLVFSEGDPDYEEEEDEDPARVAEEYDYEHFWDLAALEDAPPEDPLETELAAARAEYAELVRGPSNIQCAACPGLPAPATGARCHYAGLRKGYNSHVLTQGCVKQRRSGTHIAPVPNNSLRRARGTEGLQHVAHEPQ